MRAKMPPLPHRGRDGKVVDLEDRKMPWANGERPTREQLMERRDQRRKDMLAAFDADSDGQLSDEEREMMRETRVSGLVDKMDVDRDGRISKTELEDMRSQTRRPLPEFDKLDTDKDGFVTVEEMAKNRPPPGERGGRRGRPGGDGAAPATPPSDDPPLTK
jgi:Ca2+-binding EF-hand superfamily protein